MTKAAGQYLEGVGAVVGLAATAGFLVPQSRPGIWPALGATVLVQGPLGWWLIRSLGTERLLIVWGLGIGARVALMGAFGLIGAMLVVESVVLWLAQSAPPMIEVR